MSHPASVVSRSLLIAVASVSAFACGVAFAQNNDTVVPTAEIETSAYTFAGEVNSDLAVVRSGPSENDYPTLKLAKGAKLVVVGYRFDWLKIEPPEGSFCLVSQAFVDKRGDGTLGRIANQRATVRVGSALTLSKHKVPMQLEPGTDVQILGEVDEFYKIAPPKGVFMYIDKKFVNPVRKLDDNSSTSANGTIADNSKPAAPTDTTVPDTTPTPPSVTTTPPQTDADGRFKVVSATDATVPTTTATHDAPAEPATPTADIRKLQEKLAQLEDQYTAAAQQDITEQPIDQLLEGYKALLADEQLPPNARRVADYRVNALQLRKDTLDQFLATKKMQAEIAQKQQDLKAEQEELQQRVEQTAVKRYTAIGRLVQSSLQIGNQTLYRLVDPATSRTIIYVRSGDKPLGENLDKFVAIEGQVVSDEAAKLTYVQPTKVESVEPKQVNVKIFGEYSPPSLATQSVAGESAQ